MSTATPPAPQQWDARTAGRALLADAARAIGDARVAAYKRGDGADLIDEALAKAVFEVWMRADDAVWAGLIEEHRPRAAELVGTEAAKIIVAAAPAIRATVAEEIAKAIETAVCAPGPDCVQRYCPDCTRYAQTQADAATARTIGAA